MSCCLGSHRAASISPSFSGELAQAAERQLKLALCACLGLARSGWIAKRELGQESARLVKLLDLGVQARGCRDVLLRCLLLCLALTAQVARFGAGLLCGGCHGLLARGPCTRVGLCQLAEQGVQIEGVQIGSVKLACAGLGRLGFGRVEFGNVALGWLLSCVLCGGRMRYANCQ